MEKTPSITIPYCQHRWMMGLIGIPIAVFGFWMFGLFLESFWGEPVGIILLMLPIHLCSAGFAIFGLKLAVEAFWMVHFVPEGIAVTMFGKHLRLYQAEEFRLCYQHRGTNFHWIAVSCLDPEQLTGRREQQLRKSWMYKSSVDHKRNLPGWQTMFARDQLRAEARKAIWNPLNKDVFWMEFSPERRGFLRAMYPQISWISADQTADWSRIAWKDKYDYVFCRGLCNSGGKAGMAFVCLLFTVPLWIVLLMMPKGQGNDELLVLMACMGMTALFGILWHIGKRDYDEFWAYPDRMQVIRGKRVLEVIPAEEVRTIFRGSCYDKSGRRYYMAVSRLTEKELARKIAVKCRSRTEKILLRACNQLPNSNRLVISWYASRWMSAGVFRVPWAQNLVYSQRREEVLRERYPNAIWIDLESF